MANMCSLPILSNAKLVLGLNYIFIMAKIVSRFLSFNENVLLSLRAREILRKSKMPSRLLH